MGRVWRGNKDSGDTGPSGPFSQDPANAPWPGCLALGTAEPVRQGGRLSPSSVSRVRVLGEVPGSPHPPLPPPGSMKCLGVDGSGGGWAALVSLWEPGWLPTGGQAWWGSGTASLPVRPGEALSGQLMSGRAVGSHQRLEPSWPWGQGPGWQIGCALGSVDPPCSADGPHGWREGWAEV